LYLNINYKDKIIRNLKNDKDSKSTCDLIPHNNDIDYIVNYDCNLSTNGKEINNIKFLDKIEYNSQKFEIQKSSFLYILKDNIQNAKEDIFNKQIYILKNSIVNNNEKEFNITGELNRNISKLNNNKILIEFHFDKNKNDFKNLTCYVIVSKKSNINKVVLKCNHNENFNSNIIDGYSNLNNENLFIIFKKIENKIEMDETEPIKFRFHFKSSSGISTGAIIVIIIGGVAFVAIVGTIIFCCIIKKFYVSRMCYTKDYKIRTDYYKIVEIRFVSQNQSINYCTTCYREDNFSSLEENLFQAFPELRYKNIYFIHKGTLINRSSTVIENRISNGDLIFIYEKD